jgi:hypothetical protein
MLRKRLAVLAAIVVVIGGIALAWKFEYIQRATGYGDYEVAMFRGIEAGETPVFAVQPNWTIRCEGRGEGFSWGIIREDKRDAGWLFTNKKTDPKGGPDWSIAQTYHADGRFYVKVNGKGPWKIVVTQNGARI